MDFRPRFIMVAGPLALFGLFVVGFLLWPAEAPAQRGTVPVKIAAAPSLRLFAAGDVMLDRQIRTTIKKFGASYPFALIADQVRGHDVAIANLEGPFTDRPSVVTATHLVFTFDPAVAPTLRALGFTAFSLANNHTLNFGRTGLAMTRGALDHDGLSFFGDPQNKAGYGTVVTAGRQRVALLGYDGLTDGIENIVHDIREAKDRADVVIVMAHWGREYNLGLTAQQQRDAHALVDAGADLILGAHPHVVEPLEIYRGKLIAYSLGNFLFDQDWSRDTTEGLALDLTLAPGKTTVGLLPLSVAKSRVQPLSGPRRQVMLDRLAKDSIVPATLRASLQRGSFVLP